MHPDHVLRQHALVSSPSMLLQLDQHHATSTSVSTSHSKN